MLNVITSYIFRKFLIIFVICYTSYGVSQICDWVITKQMFVVHYLTIILILNRLVLCRIQRMWMWEYKKILSRRLSRFWKRLEFLGLRLLTCFTVKSFLITVFHFCLLFLGFQAGISSTTNILRSASTYDATVSSLIGLVSFRRLAGY